MVYGPKELKRESHSWDAVRILKSQWWLCWELKDWWGDQHWSDIRQAAYDITHKTSCRFEYDESFIVTECSHTTYRSHLFHIAYLSIRWYKIIDGCADGRVGWLDSIKGHASSLIWSCMQVRVGSLGCCMLIYLSSHRLSIVGTERLQE